MADQGVLTDTVRFGPCNYCKQPLVRLPSGGWGPEGDTSAQNCPSSPDGWHQANRLSDGSFSIGSKVWPGVSKLVEEIGELGQVLGKLVALHGDTDHWDGSDLRVRLVEEIGDVIGAVNFLIAENLTIRERIDIGQRAEDKRRLFETWHHEQGAADA